MNRRIHISDKELILQQPIGHQDISVFFNNENVGTVINVDTTTMKITLDFNVDIDDIPAGVHTLGFTDVPVTIVKRQTILSRK